MWQRKQTVFLALAALFALATWFMPVATYDRVQDQFIFWTTGLFTADGTPVTDVGLKVPFNIVLTVLAVALVGCIFFYNNRPRQIRLVRGTYLITLATIAFLFITDNSVQTYLGSGGATAISHYGVSFFLPLGTLIFSFLAERAIKADEELVRSADRLR
ncbi:MAG: DUF4293 domain-containing protein [Flavobacteriales bacterium]|nr:DUF4293 domain-containing protein [Flavobacteriales bacterium]